LRAFLRDKTEWPPSVLDLTRACGTPLPGDPRLPVALTRTLPATLPIDPACAVTESQHYEISDADCKVRTEALKIAPAGAIIQIHPGRIDKQQWQGDHLAQ
jgi:hypothetical protein